jgi:hypothetical protein
MGHRSIKRDEIVLLKKNQSPDNFTNIIFEIENTLRRLILIPTLLFQHSGYRGESFEGHCIQVLDFRNISLFLQRLSHMGDSSHCLGDKNVDNAGSITAFHHVKWMSRTS